MKYIVTQKEPSWGLRDVLILLNLVPGSSLILASFLIGKEAISSVLWDQWVARVIGYIVSSLPAVQYGQSHYRAIEKDKIVALKYAKVDFDAHMCLSAPAVQELHWWLLNLPNSFNFVVKPVVDATMNSDASLSGWGGVMGEVSTGGHWTPDEANHHIINYLELLAAYFVLKSFHQDIIKKHVKIWLITQQLLQLSTIWALATVIHAIPLLVKSGNVVGEMVLGLLQHIFQEN